MMKKYTGEVVLGILFLIYLIMRYPTPEPLATLIDNPIGKVVVLGIAVSMFYCASPLLALLSILVAIQLIMGSEVTTGTFALNNYLPSTFKKDDQFTAFNQFPYTLEQEMVNKMAPQKDPPILTPASFSPMLVGTGDAARIY
jgi:hypothetical protein